MTAGRDPIKTRVFFFLVVFALVAASLAGQKVSGLEAAAAAPEAPILSPEAVPALQEGLFSIGTDILSASPGEFPLEAVGQMPPATLPSRILAAGHAWAKAVAAGPVPAAAKAAAAARKSASNLFRAAPKKPSRDLSPMRVLERAAQHKIVSATAFDGTAAPSAEDAFSISVRAYYSASLRASRKIQLQPSHLSALRDRIGLDDAAIFRFSGREHQHGKTCARHAMAACAEANGRAAGPGGQALLLQVSAAAKFAKLSLMRELLAKCERLRKLRIENGRGTSRLDEKIKKLNLRLILADAFPENEGLNERERIKTAELAGLDYRPLGHTAGRAEDLGAPGTVDAFLKASADLKKKLNSELARKNAVMAGIYTGTRKDGGRGFHAVTILGKGRGPTGASYYVLYDSNAGQPLLYPSEKLHVFTAAVVK